MAKQISLQQQILKEIGLELFEKKKKSNFLNQFQI